jgi:hypothetical protein
MNTLIPLIAAMGALVSSAVFAQALVALHRRSAQTLSPGSWHWGGLVIDLLFAAVLLLSGWAIGIRERTPRWLALLIALLPLPVLFLLPLTAVLPRMGAVFRQPIFADPASFLYLQAGAIFWSAIYALLRPGVDSSPAGS